MVAAEAGSCCRMSTARWTLFIISCSRASSVWWWASRALYDPIKSGEGGIRLNCLPSTTSRLASLPKASVCVHVFSV